ncbi:MAG: C45 family peptidase [Patescibacteria group bacterium]
MKQYRLSGTPYECGKQLGEKMAKAIRARLAVHGITERRVRGHASLLRRIDRLVRSALPDVAEELRGLSDGARLPYETIFYLNTAELPGGHACSSIAITEKGRTILAHNEDGDARERQGMTALAHVKTNDRFFSAFVYAGELPGAGFWWNDFGLFGSVNFLRPFEPPKFGIPRIMISRALVSARTLRGALAILRRHPSASGYHHFLGEGRRIVSVEQFRGDVSVVPVHGVYFHTNHYIHLAFRDRAGGSVGSRKRLARIGELLKNTPDDPIRILFDTKQRPHAVYCQNGDDSQTLSTVLFDASNRRITVYPSRSKIGVHRFSL